MSEFEMTFPSCDLGNKEFPAEIFDVMQPPIVRILSPLKIQAYNDPTNYEIRFFAPNQVGVPNNSRALNRNLELLWGLKKDFLLKNGIEKTTNNLILFSLLHERRHLDHFLEDKLHPYLTDQEDQDLELDADKYAIEKIKSIVKA